MALGSAHLGCPWILGGGGALPSRILCRAQEITSVSITGEARTSRKCECAVLLSCVVEVSLTRKRVHARMIVSSVNIVFEDSRRPGAAPRRQVEPARIPAYGIV